MTLGRNMKTWQRIAIGIGVAIFIAGAVLAYSIYRHVTQTVPDCYAQWAAAELVIGFYSDKNEMPKGWADLAPYYSTSSPHHGGLSFEEINAKIQIDFPQLSKLAKNYPDKTEIPELIRTASGIQLHWDGAEPNHLVNYEINKTNEFNK